MCTCNYCDQFSVMRLLVAIKTQSVSSLASTTLHDAHSSSQARATTAASATSGRATAAAFESALGESLILLAGWVTDGLIDGENCAGSLARSCQNIQAHDFWLPYEFFVHVVNLALEHVDSHPEAIVLRVNLSESIENVR